MNPLHRLPASSGTASRQNHHMCTSASMTSVRFEPATPAEMPPANGRTQDLADPVGHARAPSPQQQPVGVARVAIMIDVGDRQTGELPAAGKQAGAEFELFAAVQIAVGQVADGFDGRAA